MKEEKNIDEIVKNIIINDYLNIEEKEIKKLFCAPIAKHITYIYGKNGSGKTTLARKIKEKINSDFNLFLFNDDYIQKNIFVPNFANEQNEIKVNPENNENTYELFFGEKLINLKEQLETNTQRTKENIKEWNNNVNKPSKKYSFEIKDINFFKEISWKNIENEDLNNKLGELNKILEKELVKKISLYQNAKNFNPLIKDINIIKQSIITLNENLNSLNKILEKISENNSTYRIHEIAATSKEEIKWLGEPQNKNKILKYFNELDNTKHILFNKIASSIKDIRQEIVNVRKHPFYNELIIINKELNIENNLDKFLIESENYSVIILSSKDNNKNLLFSTNLNKVNEIDELEEKKWIENFILENRYKIIEKPLELKENYDCLKKLQKEKNNIKQNRKNEETTLTISLIKRINFHLKNFKLEDLEVTLGPTNPSAQKAGLKIKLKEEKRIQTLSEGEKKILAFCYFLVDIEVNILNSNKRILIFLDDPFDSNDHYKYNNLPSINFEIDEITGPIIGFNGLLMKVDEYYTDKYNNNDFISLIISTHNLGVYFSFIENIRDFDADNRGKCFWKVNDDLKGEINLFELRKNNRNEDGTKKEIDDSSFEILIHEHFFPIEQNILQTIEKMFKQLISKTKEITNDEIDALRIFALILVKLYDGINNKKRNFYKNFIYGKWLSLENSNKEVSKADTKNIWKELDNPDWKDEFKFFNKRNIEKIIEENNKKENNINLKNMLSIIKENSLFLEDNKDSESLRKYLKKFIERFIEILKTNNKSDYQEILKRLRHKHNMHFNAIGFALEE